MIVGTAGHIDHGKTTLVRALTGVETDRLKEEQIRGISIELGYAYTPLENGGTLGFIDVPGHERLIHTMAAGASGIDFGLLVVAADDGVMPQTHEHLAILGLLGLQAGAVAITKTDRVDASRLETAQREIADLVAPTFLRDAPVFLANAAMPGCPGVAQLRIHLHTTAQSQGARRTDGLFRLAIDRAFTLQGHGTVVTGTVHGGMVRANDDAIDLRLMPAGKPVRVRSLHAQNQPSAEGQSGQRCALNLAGLDKAQVARGNWLADARCFLPSRNVDVELRLLSSADAPLRAWTPVHIHLGAAHHLAHIVPLSADTVSPGQTCKAQLVFDEPICAMAGDRYIARNAQANRTIGGGMVLDANAPDRKRRSAQRRAWLDAVAAMLAGSGLSALLAQAPYGLSENMLMRLTGRAVEPSSAEYGDLSATKGDDRADNEADMLWVASRPAATLISRSTWNALADKAVLAMEAFHLSYADEPGADSMRLKRMAAPTMPEALWLALRDQLLQQKRLARNGPWLHRPGHTDTLSDAEIALAKRVLPLIHAGAFDPPWVRDLARAKNVADDDLRQLLRKLVRQGELFQVVRDLFYHHEAVAALAALATSLGDEHGISAALFRDATGLGRKRAIQILEFFDRTGYTRRLRDLHVVRGDQTMFAPRREFSIDQPFDLRLS